MLRPYREKIKPHNVYVFREEHTKSGIEKIYITPQDKYYKAYVRQLSASEQHSADSDRNFSVYRFVFNNQPIEEDMFLELNGEVYEIDGIDELELMDSEIVIFAHKIAKTNYTTTRWS